MEQLKQSGLFFDVGRQYLPKTFPAMGWVLLPKDRFAEDSTSGLQSEFDALLKQTWPKENLSDQLMPQHGNSFSLTLFGPVSRFTNKAKLPGYWMRSKLELLVDGVAKGNRLLVSIRDARLIRWPEHGRGEPPNGHGTTLDCDAGNDTAGMHAVIEAANRLLDKASSLYGGRGLSPPECN
jgi:hypothetical protein